MRLVTLEPPPRPPPLLLFFFWFYPSFLQSPSFCPSAWWINTKRMIIVFTKSSHLIFCAATARGVHACFHQQRQIAVNVCESVCAPCRAAGDTLWSSFFLSLSCHGQEDLVSSPCHEVTSTHPPPPSAWLGLIHWLCWMGRRPLGMGVGVGGCWHALTKNLGWFRCKKSLIFVFKGPHSQWSSVLTQIICPTLLPDF